MVYSSGRVTPPPRNTNARLWCAHPRPRPLRYVLTHRYTTAPFCDTSNQPTCVEIPDHFSPETVVFIIIAAVALCMCLCAACAIISSKFQQRREVPQYTAVATADEGPEFFDANEPLRESMAATGTDYDGGL